jgi:hypothetical protein
VDLDISDNPLAGQMSVEVAKVFTLTSLTELDMSANGLDGAIPSAIGNLVQLNDLDLSSNTLSGAIPGSFLSVPLAADGLLLCGQIPPGGFTIDNVTFPGLNNYVVSRDPQYNGVCPA